MRYSPDGKWILIGRYWVRLSDSFRLPAIQGGGKAVTIQNDRYAFGDDDGSESGHSLDIENTDRIAQIPDVTFIIRIQVQETAGGTDNLTAALHARVNGIGTFDPVTTTSTNGVILANDTQGRTDDENTTERLTAGAGTFAPGKYDDGQTQLGTTAIILDTQYTDIEFAIQIDSANANDGDDFEFRIEWTDGTDLDAPYPGTYPTVTASISAPLSVQLNTLELSSNHQSLGNITPEVASVGVDTLEITSQIEDLSIQVPLLTILLNTLELQTQIENIAILAEAVSIQSGTLILESNIQSLSISPDVVSVTTDTLELQSFVEDISIAIGVATVFVESLLIESVVENVAISPSAITLSIDSLLLESQIIDLSVFTVSALSVLLNELILSFNIEDIIVSPGTASILLDVLEIGSSTDNITISTVLPVISLNTLELYSQTVSFAIAPAGISLSLDSLELASDIIDVIIILAGISYPGTIAICDDAIGTVLIWDSDNS